MAGDYTRFTDDPARRYSGVWMQQGRVQLDADWNEAVEILKRRVRTLALDTFGAVGVPTLTTPDAFLIGWLAGPPADLSIEPGRLYVEGRLAELFEAEGATYLNQPFLPDAPPLPGAGDAVVYLDVWEREVTAVEDPHLRDVALGGADTATRTQAVWQVRVDARDGARCGVDVGAPASAGRLTTEAFTPPAPDDPCLLPPQAGYRGLENRLYRVEVHDGGALGAARFKWSRDNGSIVSAVSDIAVAGGQTTLTVERIGRDPVLRFRIDDWVTVTDDHRELHGEPGEMARIVDLDEAQRQVVLDRALPTAGARAFGANAVEIAARHTRVQRWDQSAATNAIDGDGLIATAAGPIPLEAGIQVRFATDPAAGTFRVGDYWVFAARTADASVEILNDAPPRGIIHHYVQLASITGIGAAEPDVSDCRPRPEGEEAGCCCCLVTVRAREDQRADFDDLAGAIAALPNLAPNEAVPVIVCLLEGDHLIRETVRVARPRVTIRGCGWGTRLIMRAQVPVLELTGGEQAVETLAILAESGEPLITMMGNGSRIELCRLENQGPGPLVLARRVSDLTLRANLAIGSGGFELAGERIEVVENRLLLGPVNVRSPSDTVRIQGNDLINARLDAIILGDRGMIHQIDVVGNRIRGALRNGIASGFLDPEDQGRDGIIDGLRIIGNEISECVAVGRPDDRYVPPFGGIVLGRAYDLTVRDNRIERNGEETLAAVCGMLARHSRGVEISRNIIRQNGRRPDGQTFPGPQAGISLRDAGIMLSLVPDPAAAGREVVELGILPAARVADNLVESRRGPALYIRGQGPMTIEGNRFQAIDILGNFADFTFATIDQYIGTVFVFNAGRPGYFGGFLAGAGLSALAPGAPASLVGTPALTGLITGGQTQYRGNQARLDLTRLEAEIALANVAIVSLDDTVIAGNQTEGVLGARFSRPGGDVVVAPLAVPQFVADVVFADLLNLAVTTRQSHNGLMSTPLLTMFSILSHGFLNHCVENQATSCIRATGISPKSVVRDNAVIFPHPIFCPERDL
jgi:hypothetical protein